MWSFDHLRSYSRKQIRGRTRMVTLLPPPDNQNWNYDILPGGIVFMYRVYANCAFSRCMFEYVELKEEKNTLGRASYIIMKKKSE